MLDSMPHWPNQWRDRQHVKCSQRQRRYHDDKRLEELRLSDTTMFYELHPDTILTIYERPMLRVSIYILCISLPANNRLEPNVLLLSRGRVTIRPIPLLDIFFSP